MGSSKKSFIIALTSKLSLYCQIIGYFPIMHAFCNTGVDTFFWKSHTVKSGRKHEDI